jgi:hypothetical protein
VSRSAGLGEDELSPGLLVEVDAGIVSREEEVSSLERIPERIRARHRRLSHLAWQGS